MEGTVALFSANTEELNNVLNFGKVNIGVVLADNEGLDNETAYEDYTSAILNADQIVGGVRIKNLDSDDYPTVDTCVRVRVVAIWRDAQGNGTGIEVNPVFNKVSDKWIEVDGCYYYSEVLSPDEISEVLIDGVSFDDTGLDSSGYLELQVLADGIIANSDAVEDVWGSNALAVINN